MSELSRCKTAKTPTHDLDILDTLCKGHHLYSQVTLPPPSCHCVWQPYQCTMRFPMSIDILEIHKCKKSFLAHFIVKSIHSFFRWCKTAQIFTKEKNIIFLIFFVIFLWKMLKGGSEKGEILVKFRKKYLQKKSPK